MATEFARTTAQLDAIESALATLDGMVPHHHERLAAEATQLDTLHTALSTDLAKQFAKFQRRCHEIDPVTNKTVYGEAMQTKVKEQFKRYEALLERTVALQTGPMDVALKHVQIAQQAANAEARRAAEAARVAAAKAQEDAAQQQAAEAAEQARRQQEEQAWLAALGQEAAKTKEQKKRQKEEQRVAAAQAWAEARQEDDALMQSVAPGLPGAEAGLAQLRQACGGEAAKPYKEAVAALAMYMGNIIAHPEEAAYKRVREANVHFATKVGAYEGGVPCLLAAGFRVQREEIDVTANASGAGQGHEKVDEEEAATGAEATTTMPGGRVFCIEEPDIGGEQKKWTEWYDTVKGVRDRLQEEATRVKRL